MKYGNALLELTALWFLNRNLTFLAIPVVHIIYIFFCCVRTHSMTKQAWWRTKWVSTVEQSPAFTLIHIVLKKMCFGYVPKFACEDVCSWYKLLFIKFFQVKITQSSITSNHQIWRILLMFYTHYCIKVLTKVALLMYN